MSKFTRQHFERVKDCNDPNLDVLDVVRDMVQFHEQDCDDQLVTEILTGSTGRFLNIGALDGRDQSLELLRRGWHAVYCEPDPAIVLELIKTTQAYRDRVEILTVAVSPVPGLQTFHLGEAGRYNSLVKGWAARHGKLPGSELTVNCVTLRQLFQRYPRGFDYLQTDAEGVDKVVMTGVNWSEMPKLKLICTEAGASVLKHLCVKGDYMLTHMTPTNAYYQHADQLL